MRESQARECFAALSQETRLGIVRLLVRAGTEGMAAGAVAEQVGVSASNVSFHLKELERAGLITQRRESRSIIYAADYAVLGDLIGFLMKDCCAGKPEICEPVLASATCKPVTTRKRAHA
ncbi:ArsR family transcriptional regulator [Afipia sp. P52-10]|uniref:ArsR/SmtB family transcription factor n=1 Tax=Afipia sp. P52-10 TaxID=1429916 RepID=UPI0003DEF630|nr:metalloregulator ArsR/SmtB family transcription factor [Afipia sp. P52-10]ETR77026.1 ArsR family transcriptional regulator [Afipia sp. P52-10]